MGQLRTLGEARRREAPDHREQSLGPDGAPVEKVVGGTLLIDLGPPGPARRPADGSSSPARGSAGGGSAEALEEAHGLLNGRTAHDEVA